MGRSDRFRSARVFVLALDKGVPMAELDGIVLFTLIVGVVSMAKSIVSSKALENLRKLGGAKGTAAPTTPRNGRSAPVAPVAVDEDEEDEDEDEDEDEEEEEQEDEVEEEGDEDEEVAPVKTVGKLRGRPSPVVEDEDEDEEVDPMGDFTHALCTLIEVIRDNADEMLERLKSR